MDLLDARLWDAADWLLRVLAPVGAGGLAAVHVVSTQLDEPFRNDWEWDAFAALGGMAGLSLAAMALLISAAAQGQSLTHLRAHPSWNNLLDALMLAVWWWLFAAIAALVCWLVAGRLPEAIFLGSLCLGVVFGVRSLLWVSATLTHVRKPG